MPKIVYFRKILNKEKISEKNGDPKLQSGDENFRISRHLAHKQKS